MGGTRRRLPPARGGAARLTRRGRILAWTAEVFAVLILGAAGVGAWIYQDLDDNIQAADVDNKLGGDRPANLSPGSKNILVVGSDSRDGDNAQYGKGLTNPGRVFLPHRDTRETTAFFRSSNPGIARTAVARCKPRSDVRLEFRGPSTRHRHRLPDGGHARWAVAFRGRFLGCPAWGQVSPAQRPVTVTLGHDMPHASRAARRRRLCPHLVHRTSRDFEVRPRSPTDPMKDAPTCSGESG